MDPNILILKDLGFNANQTGKILAFARKINNTKQVMYYARQVFAKNPSVVTLFDHEIPNFFKNMQDASIAGGIPSNFSKLKYLPDYTVTTPRPVQQRGRPQDRPAFHMQQRGNSKTRTPSNTRQPRSDSRNRQQPREWVNTNRAPRSRSLNNTPRKPDVNNIIADYKKDQAARSEHKQLPPATRPDSVKDQIAWDYHKALELITPTLWSIQSNGKITVHPDEESADGFVHGANVAFEYVVHIDLDDTKHHTKRGLYSFVKDSCTEGEKIRPGLANIDLELTNIAATLPPGYVAVRSGGTIAVKATPHVEKKVFKLSDHTEGVDHFVSSTAENDDSLA